MTRRESGQGWNTHPLWCRSRGAMVPCFLPSLPPDRPVVKRRRKPLPVPPCGSGGFQAWIRLFHQFGRPVEIRSLDRPTGAWQLPASPDEFPPIRDGKPSV